MLNRLARLAGLTLLAGVAFVPAAQAHTHFSVQIGGWVPVAPVYVSPPPVYVSPGPPIYVSPDSVWQPGYYVRADFGGRRWVLGRWVSARYGYYGGGRFVSSRGRGRGRR